MVLEDSESELGLVDDEVILEEEGIEWLPDDELEGSGTEAHECEDEALLMTLHR